MTLNSERFIKLMYKCQRGELELYEVNEFRCLIISLKKFCSDSGKHTDMIDYSNILLKKLENPTIKIFKSEVRKK